MDTSEIPAPPCTLCGHRRDGLDVNSAGVGRVCTECEGRLTAWIVATPPESLGRVWVLPKATALDVKELFDGIARKRMEGGGEDADTADGRAQLQIVVGIAYREAGLLREAITAWSQTLSLGAAPEFRQQALQCLFDPKLLHPTGAEVLRGLLFPT